MPHIAGPTYTLALIVPLYYSDEEQVESHSLRPF